MQLNGASHVTIRGLTLEAVRGTAVVVSGGSHNRVSGCTIRNGGGSAISVSGQNGLARFIKLPPVEAKKIPDIVKYEAKQQIPFDLDDVIWDYQPMGAGAEEEGFL